MIKVNHNFPGRLSAMKPILPCSLFLILIAARADAWAQERQDVPLLKEGDYWRFRVIELGDYMNTERALNGTYEVNYASGRLAVFKLEEGRKKEMTADAGLLLGLVHATDKLQYLRFPLFVGKSWQTDYTFRPRRRDADRFVKAATKVTGFAAAAIGLGTFQAFTIERDARFKDVDHWRFVYYWSPQTKSIVSYSMEVLKGAAAGSKREIELVKFGPAR